MGTGGELPELRFYLGEQRRKRRQAAAIALVFGVLLGWFGKEPLTGAWRQVNEPERITLKGTNDGSPADTQDASALGPRAGENGDLAEEMSTAERSVLDSGASEPVQLPEKMTTTQETRGLADLDPSADTMLKEPSDAAATAAADTAPAGGSSNVLPNAIVNADRLNMRAGPNTSFDVVETLARGAKVAVLDDVDGSWVQIQSPSGAMGYAARTYLDFNKRTITLEEAYGITPKLTTSAPTCIEAMDMGNGSLLEQRSRGPHTLRITNGTHDDGVVKLKTADGKTILALYVEADGTAEITTVPDGTYRVVFATGSRWSKNCGRFLDDMQAMQFDRDETLRTRIEGNYEYYSILTYTLHRIADGNAPATHIPPEDF